MTPQTAEALGLDIVDRLRVGWADRGWVASKKISGLLAEAREAADEIVRLRALSPDAVGGSRPAQEPSVPTGDAEGAVVGQIVWRVDAPPQDGSVFYGHWWSPTRWLAYKPSSEQARRGIKGRWQTMNEFGGWENATPPNEWATQAQIDARHKAPATPAGSE